MRKDEVQALTAAREVRGIYTLMKAFETRSH